MLNAGAHEIEVKRLLLEVGRVYYKLWFSCLHPDLERLPAQVLAVVEDVLVAGVLALEQLVVVVGLVAVLALLFEVYLRENLVELLGVGSAGPAVWLLRLSGVPFWHFLEASLRLAVAADDEQLLRCLAFVELLQFDGAHFADLAFGLFAFIVEGHHALGLEKGRLGFIFYLSDLLLGSARDEVLNFIQGTEGVGNVFGLSEPSAIPLVLEAFGGAKSIGWNLFFSYQLLKHFRLIHYLLSGIL